MPYVVEPLLIAARDGIFQGLASQQLTRWGGVIRVAQGQPGAGRIVTMLRDVAMSSANPLQGVNTASSLVANYQLKQVSNQLSSVMQLSQLSAVTGVLNLGVSVAGFMIMNHKLNRLQSSMNRVAAKVQALQDHMDVRFDDLELHLAELEYLARTHQRSLEQAGAALHAIRSEQLNDKLATILHWVQRIGEERAPTDTQLESAHNDLRKVRLSLGAGLGTRSARAEQRWVLLDEMMMYRLWCAGVAVETMTLRRAGDFEGSARVALEGAQRSRQLAGHWRDQLMPARELGGVYRFGHSHFETTVPVALETRRRLARLERGEDVADSELIRLSASAAIDVAHAEPSLGREWFSEQQSAAGLLDFIEESTERLESLSEEARFTAARRLSFEDWEALPPPSDSADGLNMIRVGEAIP